MTRIMLVDDSPDVLAHVGRALREAGYRVVCVDNGLDALHQLAAQPPPDLVVLDLVLPLMGGDELLRRLGPTAPPVIVTTGTDVTAEQLRCPAVRRVIRKPYDLTTIREAVTDTLDGPPAGGGGP